MLRARAGPAVPAILQGSCDLTPAMIFEAEVLSIQPLDVQNSIISRLSLMFFFVSFSMLFWWLVGISEADLLGAWCVAVSVERVKNLAGLACF